jgi:hypothetical protein
MGRLSLLLLCAVLLLAPAAVAAEQTVDRGIVLRVMPRRLVIRELDGSRMRFFVTRAAIVKLDGRRVRLMRLQRGDVAAVEHDGSFVLAVRAFRP